MKNMLAALADRLRRAEAQAAAACASDCCALPARGKHPWTIFDEPFIEEGLMLLLLLRRRQTPTSLFSHDSIISATMRIKSSRDGEINKARPAADLAARDVCALYIYAGSARRHTLALDSRQSNSNKQVSLPEKKRFLSGWM
jgi:hypothetical protein